MPPPAPPPPPQKTFPFTHSSLAPPTRKLAARSLSVYEVIHEAPVVQAMNNNISLDKSACMHCTMSSRENNCVIHGHWMIQRTHPPFKQLGPVGYSYLFR